MFDKFINPFQLPTLCFPSVISVCAYLWLPGSMLHLIFFRAVLCSEQNQQEGTGSPIQSPTSQGNSLPHCDIPLQRGPWLGLAKLHPESTAHLRAHSWSRGCVGSDKCIMTHTCHYGIAQSGLTALKIPCSPYLSIPPIL